METSQFPWLANFIVPCNRAKHSWCPVELVPHFEPNEEPLFRGNMDGLTAPSECVDSVAESPMFKYSTVRRENVMKERFREVGGTM